MRRRFLSGRAAGCLVLALLAPAAVPGKSGVFLTLFGKRYLKGVDVVAEVDVGRVSRIGTAVEVAALVPRRIFLDRAPRARRREKGFLIMCNRGEFVEGSRFLLFLKRYGSGMMYVVCERLPFLDENYKEKVRLIKAYIDIEKISGLAARRKALKDLLLDAVGDPSEWVRWNAVYELESLAKEGRVSFSEADIGRISGLEKKNVSPSYRKKLEKILDAIRVDRKGEKK